MAAGPREIVESANLQTGVRFEQMTCQRTANKSTNSRDKNSHLSATRANSGSCSIHILPGNETIVPIKHLAAIATFHFQERRNASQEAASNRNPTLFVDFINFSENVFDVLFNAPIRIITHKFAVVADPPNVIAHS